MNLTALRHYRRQLEDMLRAELSVLERTLEASAGHSRALQEAVDQIAEEMQAALRRGLSGSEMLDRTRDIGAATIAAGQALAKVAEARDRWEQKRVDVLEAARARRTLDLLEARRQQQRVIRLQRLEQQSLDEAAHVRFLRTARDGARDVS